MAEQITPERLAKLPAWAREHLAVLTRERDQAVAALTAHNDTQDRSSGISYGDNDRNRRYLPGDRYSSFRMEIGGDPDQWIEMIASYDRLDYQVQIRAHDTMVFGAVSSNVLGVRLETRKR